MSVYKKFEPTDILNYTLHTSPKTVLASGTSGWRGSAGLSSSLSLYGGIRSRELTYETHGLRINPVIKIPTHTIDGLRTISASYPYTGSVSLAKMRTSAIALETDVDWGEKHWGAIENLYEYYSRINPEYTTASYDYYCGYNTFDHNYDAAWTFDPPLTSSASNKYNITGSMTVEGWIKPFRINTSENQIVVAGNASATTNKNKFKLFVSGSRLCFSGSDASPVRVSTVDLRENRWQHVLYRTDGTSGSFLVDLKDAGKHVVSGTFASGSSYRYKISGLGSDASGSTADTEFFGMFSEIRLWNSHRTDLQVSSSYNAVLHASSSSNLVLYARFNDGPLSILHGKTQGSGVFDYSPNAVHGADTFSDTANPVWLPNDNPDFFADKSWAEGSPTVFKVIHIPSLFYGRQIRTGSVELVCNSFAGDNHRLRRTLVDDGRGALYVSGALSSGSYSYQGVAWNKVGNVFYSEGLVVITNPALAYNFGEPVRDGFFSSNATASAGHLVNDLIQMKFEGIERIPTKVFMCRVDGAEFNASENPTYSVLNSSNGKREMVREEAVTYITSVGLYNEEHELVAVVKLAQPIRNREKDRLNVRVKLDF